MVKELHTFDRKGMEEVKRYVRENMRRLRGGQLFPGRWQKGGSGGSGSGGSSCCCSCVSVDPNLIHPTGDFLTVRDWDVTLENDTDWARNDADDGDVRVQSGTYTLSWDTTDERWEYALTVSDIDFRDDDGNISVPSAVTGQIYLEWVSTSEPVLLRIDFDGDD